MILKNSKKFWKFYLFLAPGWGFVLISCGTLEGRVSPRPVNFSSFSKTGMFNWTMTVSSQNKFCRRMCMKTWLSELKSEWKEKKMQYSQCSQGVLLYITQHDVISKNFPRFMVGLRCHQISYPYWYRFLLLLKRTDVIENSVAIHFGNTSKTE